MREEEDDPHTLLVPHHQEDSNLIERTWLESKKLWQVAAPSIFSRLAMFSVTVVTQSFAGHLSDLDLAAISIATTVIIAVTFGFMVTKTLLKPHSVSLLYLISDSNLLMGLSS